MYINILSIRYLYSINSNNTNTIKKFYFIFLFAASDECSVNIVISEASNDFYCATQDENDLEFILLVR